MGRHSYELYLGHLIPLGLIRTAWPVGPRTEASTLLLFGLYLISATLLAAFVAHFYAEPLNRRLRGARARRSPVGA